MNPRSFLIALAALLPWGVLNAQTPRDFAIDLKADVSPTPPHITLTWSLRQAANITAQVVFRRLKGETAWGTQLATLGTADTSWADDTAVPGVEYEYWMRRTYASISPNTAIGYINAGVNLPMVESRGVFLLLIDDTMLGPLGPEIAQLQQDLAADGWTVQTIAAPRRDSVTDATAAADTKALIKAAYDADPTNVKQVYIIGHVPVPYAGNSAWDGHGNHSGAWSADGYYGDMDGNWTDSTVNNSVTTNVRLTNVPGDGRLDQSTIPSPLELMVGRVDLVNMQRAPSTAASEISLLRRYLRRAHDFRYKQGAYANIERRVLIRDGFGTFGSESFMRTGWAWAFTTVGRPPEVTIDEAPSGNWWTHAATNTYLMANGNGGGSYETCSSVGATADFGRRPFKAVFTTLFGSYFGDWDVTNNFLRAPIAGNATGDSLALCNFWAGRPTWFMHHMSMGDTLGYAIRQSMNSQFSAISNPIYTPINYAGGGTHCGLLGDPALRMHIVEPPRDLTATSANGAVTLAWSASTEPALLGYHVYRAATSAGPSTRLTPTPLANPAFTDTTATPAQTYTYMVRTLKLETSPGGTYENLSQGDMATLAVNATATAPPLNATRLAVAHTSAVNAQLTWIDQAQGAAAYRIERKAGAAGSFTPLTIVAAGSTVFTDTGPFTNNNVYYYRVVATGAGGDSIPSGEASFEAIPGFYEFETTTMKVAKTIITASIPVKRFGGVNGAVSVNYATANSSAIADTHYIATNGTVTWADGESGTKMIEVAIIDNGPPQQARQFRLTLSSPSSGTGIGTYNAIAVLIEDTAATLPAPWTQSIIGSVSNSSPAVEGEGGIGSTTIGGSGLATAATSEAGQFIYQPRTGDGVMTAFVPAALPAQSGARYAIMIRENGTAGGALMAGTATSSSTSYGSKLVYRTTTNGTAVITGDALANVTPQWLRITRAGNSFTSECSPNGVAWTSLGTATVPMNTNAQWGLFHHSDVPSSTTYSANFQTASFQNITFTAISVPGAPGDFALTQPSPTRIALTWTAGTSAAGYRIERRAENGTFSQIVDLPAATLAFNDDGVAQDTGYEYRIYAFNASGNSALSSVLRVTTPPADVVASFTTEDNAASGDAPVRASAPGANFGADPVLTVAGLGSGGSLAAASKMYLRFDLNSVTASLKTAMLRLAVAETRNFAQSGYSFSGSLRMFPESADAWSESTITWDNAPLNQTTGTSFLSGTFTVGSIFISDPLAVPSPGAVMGISVTASTIEANKGANGIVTLGMNTTTTAAAIDFASREHPTLPPPTLEVTYASPLPTRPSFATAAAVVASANIDLTWIDNSSTETGFQIERRPVGGTFALLQTTAPDATSFTDTTTSLGVAYEYRIRAASATGDSAWSLTVGATAGGSTGHSTGLMTYQSWLLGYNQPANLADTADLDRDGMANLVEYALGLQLNTHDASGKPIAGTAIIDAQEFLTLTFARRIDATGVVIAVEVSGSLTGPWTALDPLNPQNQIEAIPDMPELGWETLVIKDIVPLGAGPQRFMRLNVKRP
ncbi:MAG: DNRLRE domain-containing protein [Chthoniobacteraceae bacterium]